MEERGGERRIFNCIVPAKTIKSLLILPDVRCSAKCCESQTRGPADRGSVSRSTVKLKTL